MSPSDDTAWLSKEQMALLFGCDRTVISKHINKIYKEGELEKKRTCAKNAHVHSMTDSLSLMKASPTKLEHL